MSGKAYEEIPPGMGRKKKMEDLGEWEKGHGVTLASGHGVTAALRN